MWYYSISALVNGLILTGLGLFVYFKNRHSKTNITYGLFCFFISLWSYSYFFWQISDTADNALFWCKSLTVGSIFIPITYLHFVFYLVNRKKRIKKIIYVGYPISFFFFGFIFTPLMVKSIEKKMFFPFWPNSGILYGIFLIYFSGYSLYTLVELFINFKKSSSTKQNQLKYILIGSLLGYLGGAANFPLWYDIEMLPIGNILIAVYVALVAYAIVKHHLMDIKVALTRVGIFLFVYTLILGIPFYLGFQTKQWLLPTTTAIVLATIGPLIYRIIQRKAENLLLAQQKNYQRVLYQAASGMVRIHNLDKLLKLIVYVVRRAVKIRYATIFLHKKESQRYILKVARDHHNIKFGRGINENSALISFIKKEAQPILAEKITPKIRSQLEEEIGTPFSIIVPSIIENRIIAFMILGEKKDKSLYTPDDLNMFSIVANQSALAIENCLFFEQFKKTQKKIFNAEKLASIGGMADGVAHQIKNRLNQFSIASGEIKYEISDFAKNHKEILQNYPGLRKSFDYLNIIGEKLISNVKKTDAIVKGILGFARVEEKETYFGKFKLSELIEHCLELLKIKHEITQIPLETKIPDNDILYGVKSQILESVYNLLDNAFEAIREKEALLAEKKEQFTPKISLELLQTKTSSQIKITDNGIGIKKNAQKRLFAPFFTTKSSYKSGTGIGLYVIKRMVEENHKGQVWFKSKYLKGTEFLVKLPRKMYNKESRIKG